MRNTIKRILREQATLKKSTLITEGKSEDVVDFFNRNLPLEEKGIIVTVGADDTVYFRFKRESMKRQPTDEPFDDTFEWVDDISPLAQIPMDKLKPGSEDEALDYIEKELGL